MGSGMMRVQGRRGLAVLIAVGTIFAGIGSVNAGAAPAGRRSYIVTLNDNAGDPGAIAVAQSGSAANVSTGRRGASTNLVTS